jgi:hypothetical protein
MDLFTYRDKISQPLTACKRNPGVCAYTQTVSRHFMKRLYKYTLTVFLTVILCSAKTDKKQFDEYRGGRFGYSSVTIKLYNDSTYYYSEWNHTGRSIKDNGKWGKINDHYYLNSTSKTRWTSRNGKSDKIYRFETQEFNITIDTLRFMPKDAKDNDYFDAYYTLYKVTNTK